jgi:ADP-ribose pyrophosphatase YjhB (NUDIX family)
MPLCHGAAGGLITDDVRHWGFSGGAMNAGETARWEIREEIGLAVTLGTLLVVDWV